MEAISGLSLVWMVFLLILAVLWFLLPFAIFGTKDRLRDLLEAQNQGNQELIAIRKQLTAIQNQQNDQKPADKN